MRITSAVWRIGLAALLAGGAGCPGDSVEPGAGAVDASADPSHPPDADVPDGGVSPDEDAAPAGDAGDVDAGSKDPDPADVLVYINNVENLENPDDGCPGDWEDLIWEMRSGPSPDLFLVQQLDGRAQLDELLAFMNDHLPGIYAGVIAEDEPAPQRSPCGAQKRFQTNAIVYRTARFEPVGARAVWQAWANVDGECRRNFQARTKAVMQKFRDVANGKLVTVASIHWSTAQGTGPDPACAVENVREVDAMLGSAGFGADLTIFGGDANESDRSASGFKAWYELANGDRGGALGYRDPVYRACMVGSRPLRECLEESWTVGSGARIDFLFARTGSTMPDPSAAHTVTFDEADAAAEAGAGADSPANYSDHRAVRARIHY